MCTEVDFKALWNKEEAKDIPDTKDLLKKASSLRRMARLRLIFQSVVLSGTVGVLLWVGFTIHNQQLTTTIGWLLMLAAIVAYLITTGELWPMLFKSDIEGSSQQYLSQLIRIKRKHEFLDKVMINIYFSLLVAGTFLFLLQSAAKLSIAAAVISYVIILGCLAVCWFYSKTREQKKTIKPLNDTIKRLEAVNEQLRDSE